MLNSSDFLGLRRAFVVPAIAAAALVLTPIAASATVFDIPGPTATDIDVDPASPLELTFNVAETGIVEHLGVRLDINLYWDNIFASISHLGTTVVLMDLQTDNAGEDSELVATFADGGAPLVPIPHDVTSGVFAPQESLSAFDGMPLEGDWTFTFYDDAFFVGDGSNLLASSIFGPTDVPEPATLTILGLGLAGLGLIRRKRQN